MTETLGSLILRVGQAGDALPEGQGVVRYLCVTFIVVCLRLAFVR
jgi:hypothetical protein